MDLKTSDQPRWIVVVSAMLGLAATVVSIYTSIAADQLKTNAAELESRLKLLEVELKTVDQRT